MHKKLLLSVLAIFILSIGFTSAQVFEKILVCNVGETPVHGVKIKTKIPFSSSHMPTINIRGYNYGGPSTLNIQLSWYQHKDNFINCRASSSGGSAPKIYLSRESDGMVSIFIDQKIYFQRFVVSAFNTVNDIAVFSNWTYIDEPANADKKLQVHYYNDFGNVVIGKSTPGNLTVYGSVDAEKITVKTLTGADFVFESDYNLRPLSEVESFIKENKHLPEIQSAKDMITNGVSIDEFQIQLLQKIEELTLYTIEQNKKLEEQAIKIKALEEHLNFKNDNYE